MLINGTKRTDGFISYSSDHTRRDVLKYNISAERLLTFTFRDFKLKSYYTGEVRCAIFDPDRMSAPEFSNATFINFTSMTYSFYNFQ
jgi:hypothetical protein